ncbi:MAG: TonB-dependent receptor [Bacteroidales bacterium]|nr:TonB-dependent receptor [Bacteroidales bacterium]
MKCSSLIAFVVIFFSAFGQIDTNKLLKEVIVDAERVKVSQYTATRYIQIITADEIKKIPSLSVTDILDYANNVDIRERGIWGVQADIQIRTGNFEQTLVLLNGIPLNDPQTGHHTGHIPVDPQIIERIEILTGAGTRIFGMNAYSGVINIVTKKETQEKLLLQVLGGDFKTFQTTLTYSPYQKIKGFLANFHHRQSNGFKANTDYRISQIYFQYHQKISNAGEITGFLMNGNKNFGAYNFYTPKFPHQFENNWLTMAGLTYKKRFLHSALVSQAYIRRHQDRFELFRHDLPEHMIPSWYVTHNYHLTYSSGLQNSYIYVRSFGKFFTGLDLKYETIYSNKLGTISVDSIPTIFDNGFYTRKGERWYISVPFDLFVQINKLSFSAGTIVTYYTNQEKVFILPGFDVSYQIGEKHQFFVSANINARVPSFTEMYYTDPAHTGNPDLLPEKGYQLESGWHWFSNPIKLHLNAYYRNCSNAIDWVRSSVQEKWQTQNITNMQTYGLEADLIWLANFKWIKKIQLFYAYNELLHFKSEFFSKYALDFLKHKTKISIELDNQKKWNGSFSFIYQYRQSTYQDYPSGELKKFKPVYLLNAKVSYNLRKNILLFTSIYNLLNQHSFDFGLIPLPPRWAMLGINVSIR